MKNPKIQDIHKFVFQEQPNAYQKRNGIEAENLQQNTFQNDLKAFMFKNEQQIKAELNKMAFQGVLDNLD